MARLPASDTAESNPALDAPLIAYGVSDRPLLARHRAHGRPTHRDDGPAPRIRPWKGRTLTLSEEERPGSRKA
jgi:hypothetical protein